MSNVRVAMTDDDEFERALRDQDKIVEFEYRVGCWIANGYGQQKARNRVKYDMIREGLLKPLSAPSTAPLPPASAPVPLPPELADKPPSTLTEDVEWVYHHHGKTETEELVKSAPSLGAINLLRYVNESAANRAEFYKSMVPKVLLSQERLEGEQRRNVALQPLYDLLERKLAECVAEVRVKPDAGAA